MVTIVWKESKGTAKSRYKARRAELIAERRSNEALARKNCAKALWLRQSRQSSITRKPLLQEERRSCSKKIEVFITRIQTH